MSGWRLWCGCLLILSLTSCGDNTSSTVSPTANPTAAVPESLTSSPLVASTIPTAKPQISPAASSKPALETTKIKISPTIAPSKSVANASIAPVVIESSESSLDNNSSASSMVVSKASLAALQGIVDTTKTAIEEGKLDEAKTEFAKFEDSWQTVEDGIRSKSADTYKAIEEGVKLVNSGISGKQAKSSLLASLQKLSKNIENAGN
jgi:hypothetical protein